MFLSPQNLKKSITRSVNSLIEFPKFNQKEITNINSNKNKNYLDSQNINDNLKNPQNIIPYKKIIYNNKKIDTFVRKNNQINKNKFRFLSNYTNINNNYSTTTNIFEINNNKSTNIQNFSIYNYLITNSKKINSNKISPSTKNFDKKIINKFYSTNRINSTTHLKKSHEKSKHIILNTTNNNLKDAKNINSPLSPTHLNKNILQRHSSEGNIISLKQILINKNKLSSSKFLSTNSSNKNYAKENKNEKNQFLLNIPDKCQTKYFQILKPLLTKQFKNKSHSRSGSKSKSKSKSKSRCKTKSFIKTKSTSKSKKKAKDKSFLCNRKISSYNTKKNTNLYNNNKSIDIKYNETKNNIFSSVEETHFNGVLFYQNIKKQDQLLG